MRADLDTLVIAVYCAACSLFPAASKPRRGRPQRITDDELPCLMVAQMLFGQPSDRRFLALSRWRLGHLFPALPSRPSRTDERQRPIPPIGRIRRRIESIVDTLKDQLRLEHHPAKTPAGIVCRITARVLALTAAIHLDSQTGRPARALTTYGH